MKKNLFTQLLLTASLLFFTTVPSFGQCVIEITGGVPYIENFEDDFFECWTMDSINNSYWSSLTVGESTVACFNHSSTSIGGEARLISPVFDFSSVQSATLSFSFTIMGLYDNDMLTVSYRSSEDDPWHDFESFSFSDWESFHDASFSLPNLSSTYQISFLGRNFGGYYIFIDNMEIASELTCARPVNLEANNITPYSALLSWSTTGNETSWNLEINGTQMDINTQPFLLEDLHPHTAYTFRIRANCAEGNNSDWSIPATFTTSCDVITVTDDEPYFDDFEASEDFVCWQDEIVEGSLGWAIDPGSLTPNNSAFFIWLCVAARLVSPPLDITAVTNPTLNFKRKQPHNLNNADELSVFYRVDETDAWHYLDAYITVADNWEEVLISLPNPSATYQICFMGIAANGSGVFVDDVRVGKHTSVGISETSQLTASLNPNPTSDKVTVTSNVSDGIVTIHDLFGRQVLKATLVNGSAELDLSGFTQGIYTARISGANGFTAIKLVRQ